VEKVSNKALVVYLGYYTSVCMGQIKTTKTNFNQYIRPLRCNLNPRPFR